MNRKKPSNSFMVAIGFFVIFSVLVLPTDAAKNTTPQYYGTQLSCNESIKFYQEMTKKVLADKKADCVNRVRYRFDNPLTSKEQGELFTASMAFYYDYPEKYWIDDIHSISLVEGNTVEIQFSSFEKRNDKDDHAIMNRVNEIVGIANKEKTDYDKLRVVHDSLAQSITYGDTTNKRAHQITGALVDYQGVCESYAKAFKLISNRMGYNCILVGGTGTHIDKNGEIRQEPHMWNYVEIDGQWYAVDVTWDDQEFILDDYFLVGADTVDHNFGYQRFIESHKPEQFHNNVQLQYPSLSKTAYPKSK